MVGAESKGEEEEEEKKRQHTHGKQPTCRYTTHYERRYVNFPNFRCYIFGTVFFPSSLGLQKIDIIIQI